MQTIRTGMLLPSELIICSKPMLMCCGGGGNYFSNEIYAVGSYAEGGAY